jgi:hypothetical protein
MAIIHRLVFYLKHDVSENEFCLRVQVEPTHFSSIDRVSLCFQNISKMELIIWRRE